MQPLRIFIGYDPREAVAYHVLAHSILQRASRPVSITPLARKHLASVHSRPKAANESTDFSLTRFLVPYLCDYGGWALFMDCDMLCLTDIYDVMLYPMAEPGKAVYVCQHDYVPKATSKFLGAPQAAYPKKNWSSFMLFDCAQCEALTPAYVNTASGAELQRFEWLKGEMGSLPLEWNWLVGEYPLNPTAKVLHYTLGGPWFEDYAGCDHAIDWLVEADAMLHVVEAASA